LNTVAAKVQGSHLNEYGTGGCCPCWFWPCCSWWSGNTFAHNRFIPATGPESFKDILTDASQYVNALSFVLTASLATQHEWADSPTNDTCGQAVREGAAEAGTKTYNIKPAVMAGTFGAHFLADTYTNSTGFPHVVSMHSANLVATVQMRDNFANSSVLRIIDATANVYSTTLSSNQVMGGSVLQGDSFKGRFEEVGFRRASLLVL
jgi:hypothetical protein